MPLKLTNTSPLFINNSIFVKKSKVSNNLVANPSNITRIINTRTGPPNPNLLSFLQPPRLIENTILAMQLNRNIIAMPATINKFFVPISFIALDISLHEIETVSVPANVMNTKIAPRYKV